MSNGVAVSAYPSPGEWMARAGRAARSNGPIGAGGTMPAEAALPGGTFRRLTQLEKHGGLT
jgi:hypothetical protein